jgi:hypothetical protein
MVHLFSPANRQELALPNWALFPFDFWVDEPEGLRPMPLKRTNDAAIGEDGNANAGKTATGSLWSQ